jgi:hypothetical protein
MIWNDLPPLEDETPAQQIDAMVQLVVVMSCVWGGDRVALCGQISDRFSANLPLFRRTITEILDHPEENQHQAFARALKFWRKDPLSTLATEATDGQDAMRKFHKLIYVMIRAITDPI